MPLIFTEESPGPAHIALWSVQEELSFFLDRLNLPQHDLDFVRSLHPRRALEWSASRHLLARMIGPDRALRCTKDAHGKPVIPGDPVELSISHSYGMAAVLVADRRAGVDVQRRTPKIRRVRHKFVGTTEEPHIDPVRPDPFLQICWGAKEALFKVYALGQVDFRQHLFV
ncbi:MAG: hypothetical protein R3330_04130, partial [Saprospiraceae bacterium]|nr:hypothetical protein [Saprospiraceae bacterium]